MINLIEKTRNVLGFPPLRPIDVSSQDLKDGSAVSHTSQAVLSAVLAGIYRLSKSDEGLEEILNGNYEKWGQVIFGDSKSEVVNKIASYCKQLPLEIEEKINDVAAVAIRTIHDQLPGSKENPNNVRKFLSEQRNSILSHLPAQLDMGHILSDNTLDDRTNKMQGPFSTWMHKIEEGFSRNDTDEEIRKKTNNF